jgi:methylenetetrahydrofolate dehydrogenase (NADP+) / methenyltetrahydrofolate cyclohydrolase
MTQVIDGRKLSSQIKERIKSEVKAIVSNGKRPPCLAVVLVGSDEASKVYVGHKEKACEQTGITSKAFKLDEKTPEAELLDLITKLNSDQEVDGILVQLPLPRHLNSDKIIQTISPLKDVDGLTYINQGKLAVGDEGLFPCTPSGCIELIKTIEKDLSGKKAVVVGRSILVGSPVAKMLTHENATVTMVHSRTPNPQEICKEADILVVAAGRKRLVDSSWVKKGAIVIDVGIHRHEGKLVGDVDYEDVSTIASAITPVPGGVGPMTIGMLMQNCLESYKREHL